MTIIIWIFFGALVGWIASLVMKTDSQQGSILNIVVGIVGAVVGGWIMNFFGQSKITGFDMYAFMVALMGAIVFIAVIKVLRHL